MEQQDINVTLPSKLYFSEQIKQGELVCAQKLQVDMYQLMEKAGHAVFETFLANFSEVKKVIVLAGRGNNGGDAYVFARLAIQSNYDVNVYAESPQRKLTGDAEIARQSYVATGAPILDSSELPEHVDADVVVDGLLGTGFCGVMRKAMATVVSQVNTWQKPVIAIDLPSGLNADTGIAESVAIIASYTVTFVALKVGLFTANGPDLAGKISFTGLDIAALFEQISQEQAHLIKKTHLAARPKRMCYSNKGTYGHVLCIGGDEGMAGAIYLAAKSALRVGAGKVSVVCHSNNAATVTTLCPELMVLGCEVLTGENKLNPAQLGKVQQKITSATCIVLGPGLGQSLWSKAIFEFVYSATNLTHKPLILDADALNLLAQQPRATANTGVNVITPHPLEAARLLDCKVSHINENRLAKAEQLATKFNAMCVLKGNGSIVASGQHKGINTSGHPGMATAGMGDVLAGIIAGIFASSNRQSQSLPEDLEFSVYLHGFAAELAAKNGKVGIIASDVIEHLPLALSYN